MGLGFTWFKTDRSTSICFYYLVVAVTLGRPNPLSITSGQKTAGAKGIVEIQFRNIKCLQRFKVG